MTGAGNERKCKLKRYILIQSWGCGSVGRAMRSQCMGQGFESPHLHQNLETDLVSVFSFVFERGFAQLCCAQLCCMNPCQVRASAYSLVRARSFRYYAYGYESPRLRQHKKLTQCFIFFVQKWDGSCLGEKELYIFFFCGIIGL